MPSEFDQLCTDQLLPQTFGRMGVTATYAFGGAEQDITIVREEATVAVEDAESGSISAWDGEIGIQAAEIAEPQLGAVVTIDGEVYAIVGIARLDTVLHRVRIERKVGRTLSRRQ